MPERPRLDVAVLMRREKLDNRWQPWRWSVAEVVPAQPAFGDAPRLLLQDEAGARWLHPGFAVELFPDDTEGYYLNASTPQPSWFVLWRMDEPQPGGEEPLARPVAVSLSYHDAGRWLDAQESVDAVPVPPEVADWLREYVALNWQPEPRRRQRPESFRPLQDRFGNPASVSTQKKQRGGGG
ncbi:MULTISPECIES: DUF3305 domain-containing protein [Ramlibacter]|uniref:DUF3305 domain-containing protein n=1 Tax=Ramlibacter aquaticus TaxID=2780094 RepID=A0ABR9SF44_9BURK|nr:MULTISPECIES: DUF3305 domain-containing protein [Ramlibacter]MBE7940977.1 DUF3305 domain-containing protein [Ramlibacter aquaticus]